MSLTLDNCCCAGGTSIEDLAEKYPEKIIKIPIDVFEGITDQQVIIHCIRAVLAANYASAGMCCNICLVCGIYRSFWSSQSD